MIFWKASVYRALHRWSGLTTISIGGAFEGFDRALQSPPEFFLRVYAIEKSLFFGSAVCLISHGRSFLKNKPFF